MKIAVTSESGPAGSKFRKKPRADGYDPLAASPTGQRAPDPDAQRYKIRPRAVLGTVEALAGNSDAEPGTKTGDQRTVHVNRQNVVNMLRLAGLWELAGEASRVLPDPVEHNLAERFLAQYGITRDQLISRRGGSP